MTHLCEIHRAYNCHHETCKLLARSGEALGKEASDDLEGFDDLLPQAEPATVLTLRPEPQPAKVAPVAAPVAAVPAPAKLTLKQPPAKPVATPLPALNVKNPQTSQPVTAVAVKPAPVTPAKPTPDLAEIEKALNILIVKDSGRVVELRAFDTPKRTVSGYYNDCAVLARDTYLLSEIEEVPNVYWTLQEIDPCLLARLENAAKAWSKNATADSNVLHYLYLPFDFDPCRVSGVSSSDGEKARAFELATIVRAFLSEHGIATILADSGNGCHLLARIDLPVSRESTALVSAVLAAAYAKFSTCKCDPKNPQNCGKVAIDKSLSNPSRILKAYGTVARKGSHTAERPWRLSKIVDVPGNMGVVSEQLLRALVKEMGGEVAAVSVGMQPASDASWEGMTPEQMEGLLAEKGIEHGHRIPYKSGYKWQLKKCVFADHHESPDSFIALERSGLHYFRCSHPTCDGHIGGKEGWAKFKEQVGGFEFPAAAADAPAAESLPWAEPKPFEPLLSPVPYFKIEYLPAAFRPWALDVSERMSIPLDYVGICMLITFASVIGRRAFVYPKANDKSWTEAINLLGAVIAPSGGMKTPTWKIFTNEVTAIEIEWKKQHEREVAKYKQELAKYLEENRGKKKDAREGVPPEEPAPYRRLVINDATPESAHILMGKNPEGLLLYRDEIGGWLVELDKSGREAAREIFLVAANGNDSHTQDRVERGEVSAIMCLSFFGGMQPKIAQDMVNDERNAADGTIARLGLLSYPDRTEAAVPMDRTLNEEVRASFRRALRVLAPLREKQIMLRFTEDAQPIFNEWLKVHFQREFALQGPIASHFSKYKGLLPRLAALYHLADAASSVGVKVEQAEGEETSFGGEMSVVGLQLIGAEHVKRAITFLAEYLEPHMRRLYGCVRDPRQRAEAALGEHILAGELEDGFTARGVVRKAWAHLKDYETVRSTLETFTDELGWLRPVKTEGQRGMPTVRYEINPKVKELRKQGEPNGSQNS